MSKESITVTNTVTIDHWELGRNFAQWDNEQQALFLHGLHEGLLGMNGLYGIQLLTVFDYAKVKGFELDLTELVSTLHACLTPEPTA